MTLARPYPIATCILFSQTEMTCGLLNSEVWLPNFSKFKAFLDLALFLVSILKVALSRKVFYYWSHFQRNMQKPGYGNMGCRVFRGGDTKLERFLPKN